MGNTRNRKRKSVRITPSKAAKKFKDGGPSREIPGSSGVKIGDQTANFGVYSEKIQAVKAGTIFMDLSILFAVFNDILKCPECGSNMNSHVDMRKNGFSDYIVLECQSLECEWKYCFNTSKKQGHSHEVNVRAVLAFREIGRGHTTMTTFTKVMNMPSPPMRSVYTKIQNKKLLPIVKQLANDTMNNSAMEVKESSGSDEGECGISLDGSWQKKGSCVTQWCCFRTVLHNTGT